MISVIDLLAIALLIYAGFKGYRIGLINIFFDVFSLTLSFYLTHHYYKSIGRFLQSTLKINTSWQNTLTWDNVLVWVLTFILCFILLKLLGHLLTRLFGQTMLGAWNHTAGLILNVSKWVVIIWLCILILLNLPIKTFQDYCHNALIYKAYVKFSTFIPVKNLLPKKLH